jgi:HipA-like protein
MVETQAMSVLDPVLATRYVTALREGGSLPGLVEGDDDGLYVAKFRGAGQGVRALVAEVIVGELIRRAGLPVPRLVRIEIDARLGAAEPDPEIQELLAASVGENLGVDFLPGSLPYSAAGAWQPEADLAAEIVWLDALTTNVDRTARNPNMLLWHERLWLIDHGAALYLQHAGLRPELAARPFPLVADHVLLRRASSIPEAGERLRARLDLNAAIAESLTLVPPDWFEGGDPPPVYAEYLTARCAWAGFEQEGERARRALA